MKTKIALIVILALATIFALTACNQLVNYTVTFVDYDGTVLATHVVMPGAEAKAPTEPTREADENYTYTFIGWDVDFSQVNQSITVTAQYEQTPIMFTVTFVNYNGEELKVEEVAKGGNATAPETDPTKPADNVYTYAFSGWDVAFTNVQNDITVTATYTETLIVYYNLSVAVIGEGQVNITVGEYKEGDEVLLVATATEGNFFAGWMIEGEVVSTEASYTYIMGDEDVNITAEFKYIPDPGYYLACTNNDNLEDEKLVDESTWKFVDKEHVIHTTYKRTSFGVLVEMGDSAGIRANTFKVVRVNDDYTIDTVCEIAYSMPTNYLSVWLVVEYSITTNTINLHLLDYYMYFSPFL